MAKRNKLDYALGRKLKLVSKLSPSNLKPAEVFLVLEEAIKRGDWRTYRQCFTRQAHISLDGQRLSVSDALKISQNLSVPQTLQFSLRENVNQGHSSNISGSLIAVYPDFVFARSFTAVISHEKEDARLSNLSVFIEPFFVEPGGERIDQNWNFIGTIESIAVGSKNASYDTLLLKVHQSLHPVKVRVNKGFGDLGFLKVGERVNVIGVVHSASTSLGLQNFVTAISIHHLG